MKITKGTQLQFKAQHSRWKDVVAREDFDTNDDYWALTMIQVNGFKVDFRPSKELCKLRTIEKREIQETSLISFYEIQDKLGERQTEVFNIIKEKGAINNTMIAEKLNLPISSITPRTRELRRFGLVEFSHIDLCPFTKRQTIFWKVKEIKQ